MLCFKDRVKNLGQRDQQCHFGVARKSGLVDSTRFRDFRFGFSAVLLILQCFADKLGKVSKFFVGHLVVLRQNSGEL